MLKIPSDGYAAISPWAFRVVQEISQNNTGCSHYLWAPTRVLLKTPYALFTGQGESLWYWPGSFSLLAYTFQYYESYLVQKLLVLQELDRCKVINTFNQMWTLWTVNMTSIPKYSQEWHSGMNAMGLANSFVVAFLFVQWMLRNTENHIWSKWRE